MSPLSHTIDLSDALSRARQRMGFCALAFAVVFVATPGGAIQGDAALFAFMVGLPVYGLLSGLQAWLISEREHGWQWLERVAYLLDLPIIGLGLALAPAYLYFLSPLMAVVALIRGIRYGPWALALHSVLSAVILVAVYLQVPAWQALGELVVANLFLLAALPLHFYRVSERIHANSKNLQVANLTDPLTKVPNRKALELALQDLMAQQRPFVISFMDLDNFKCVNDTLGHATGDKLLRRICAKLSVRLRTEDQVFRLAGDEFVVLSTGFAKPELAKALGERIQQAVLEAVNYTTPGMAVSASVGIVFAKDSAIGVSKLLEKADQLMYQAKKAGKNTVLVEAN
ncbi:GGDEF domain-containing protein [Limnobacter sp.]|uniref:GGDEF domain-containing protein n=1 Tax=Limnobacter sp. TaxID=2003368 RepID=UPI0035182F9D